MTSSVGWRKPARQNLKPVAKLDAVWTYQETKSSPEISWDIGRSPSWRVGWGLGLSYWVILRSRATPGVWDIWMANSGVFWIEYFVFLSILGKNNKITCKCFYLASACVSERAIPAPNSEGYIVITQGVYRSEGSLDYCPGVPLGVLKAEVRRACVSRTGKRAGLPCLFTNSLMRGLKRSEGRVH